MLKNNIRKSLLEQGQLLSDKFFLEADLIIQRTVIKKINIFYFQRHVLIPLKFYFDLLVLFQSLILMGSTMFVLD